MGDGVSAGVVSDRSSGRIVAGKEGLLGARRVLGSRWYWPVYPSSLRSTVLLYVCIMYVYIDITEYNNII